MDRLLGRQTSGAGGWLRGRKEGGWSLKERGVVEG
jgi:hypothetical protein